MNLEDHLGDILRKARLMKGLSPAAVASAGGLTEPELAALENTGSGLAHQNLATLASLLELNPGKLDSIARDLIPDQIAMHRVAGFGGADLPQLAPRAKVFD